MTLTAFDPSVGLCPFQGRLSLRIEDTRPRPTGTPSNLDGELK